MVSATGCWDRWVGGGDGGNARSHLLVFFVCSVRRRTLVIHCLKTCQSKKIADSSGRFEEYLENVLCIIEGKGFKIRLKSEQKKAIRQYILYILKCELL